MTHIILLSKYNNSFINKMLSNSIPGLSLFYGQTLLWNGIYLQYHNILTIFNGCICINKGILYVTLNFNGEKNKEQCLKN